MSAVPDIVVVFEPCAEGIPETLPALAAAARRIAGVDGHRIGVILAGRSVAGAATAVAEATGWDVTGIENEALAPFNAELTKPLLAGYLSRHPARWVLMAQSAASQELAPGLAQRLSGVCVCGVQEVAVEGGAVVLRRPVFGGKLVATVAPEAWPAVVTLLPGPPAEQMPLPPGPGRVRIRSMACPGAAARVTDIFQPETQGAALAEAATIVAAGNGVAGPEQMAQVKALARCFPRSAVAGSRPVCDRGWLPHGLQVGLTGATVRPDLYIACGISGAFQHVAGMREAGFIAAINRDPQAAIFQVADVGIVADLAEFLPVLIAALEENREKAGKKKREPREHRWR